MCNNEYLLNKPDAHAVEKDKIGYRMELSGKARDGRLTWKSNYRSTDVFGGVLQRHSTKIDLNGSLFSAF
jgi:hypothetical protein